MLVSCSFQRSTHDCTLVHPYFSTMFRLDKESYIPPVCSRAFLLYSGVLFKNAKSISCRIIKGVNVKRILSGVFVSVIMGVAQADTLEISNTSAITFFDYNGQPIVTGAQNRGSRGSSAAISSGIMVAANSGNESGYLKGDKQQESGGLAALN